MCGVWCVYMFDVCVVFVVCVVCLCGVCVCVCVYVPLNTIQSDIIPASLHKPQKLIRLEDSFNFQCLST